MADRIFVAKETFFYSEADGSTEAVRKGDRYREGHPIVDKFSDLFTEDTSVREIKRPVGRPRKTEE